MLATIKKIQITRIEHLLTESCTFELAVVNSIIEEVETGSIEIPKAKRWAKNALKSAWNNYYRLNLLKRTYGEDMQIACLEPIFYELSKLTNYFGI